MWPFLASVFYGEYLSSDYTPLTPAAFIFIASDTFIKYKRMLVWKCSRRHNHSISCKFMTKAVKGWEVYISRHVIPALSSDSLWGWEESTALPSHLPHVTHVLPHYPTDRSSLHLLQSSDRCSWHFEVLVDFLSAAATPLPSSQITFIYSVLFRHLLLLSSIYVIKY